MSDYRKTYWCSWTHPINGIERTAHEIADKYQVDCRIDTDVRKTGWFSKEYEYNVIYSGEKESVEKAYAAIHKCGEDFRTRLTIAANRL